MAPSEIRVICSTSSLWMWELERTFGVIAEAGFDGVELMVTRDRRTQTGDVSKNLAAKAGLEIVAVHAPMLVITRRVWGPNFRPIIEKSARLAKDVGAEVVIIHPPYLWEFRYQTWLLGRLDTFSADSGVGIAVENMFRVWLAGRPVRGYRWISPTDIDRFSQVTLDTSHCGVDDFDILRALDVLEGKISHVHLSDSLGDHRDNHALPGKGNLPLEAFVQRLGQTGFKGALSLELDLRPYADNPARLKDAITSARNFCLESLS